MVFCPICGHPPYVRVLGSTNLFCRCGRTYFTGGRWTFSSEVRNTTGDDLYGSWIRLLEDGSLRVDLEEGNHLFDGEPPEPPELGRIVFFASPVDREPAIRAVVREAPMWEALDAVILT
jgi:hypothetical protein